MDVIFAVIGLIYISCVLLNQKASDYTSKRDREERYKRLELWEERLVADNEYRRRIEGYVFAGGGRNAEAIYTALEDNLKAAFGDDYRSKFPIPGTMGDWKNGGFLNNAEWVQYLLLSKDGKIPWYIIYEGYPIGGTYAKDITIPLCHQIELNLQMYYPEIELVMRPSQDINYKHEVVDNWNPCGKKLEIKQTLWKNAKYRKLW